MYRFPESLSLIIAKLHKACTRQKIYLTYLYKYYTFGHKLDLYYWFKRFIKPLYLLLTTKQFAEIIMYNTFTKSKGLIISMIVAGSMLVAATAVAGNGKGKGKPGKNEILEGGTIAEIAAAVNGANGQFTNLLGVVGCFGPVTLMPGDNPIIDLLNGSDKYTLFAPTDTAFVNLLTRLESFIPGVTQDPCILDDSDNLAENTLFTVLAYHVVEGRRFSNSVFNVNSAKMVETLAGADITTYVESDGAPVLHDVDGQTVGVVSPLININAVNGVIHVIDTVLLPINFEDND